MTDFALSYAKQLKRAFHTYFANWLPDAPIALGDIGTLEKKVLFQRISSLSSPEFLISFDKVPSQIKMPKGDRSNHYQFKTSGVSSVTLIPKATVGPVKVGLEIKLKGDNSFFFNLAGTATQQINDLVALSKPVVELYKQGRWNKDWYIVTGIVLSPSTTILGSRNGDQSITLEAKTEIPEISLADSEIQLSASSASHVDYSFISNQTLVPLFKIAKLRTPIFGSVYLGMVEEEVDLDELRIRALNGNVDFNEYFQLEEVEDDDV